MDSRRVFHIWQAVAVASTLLLLLTNAPTLPDDSAPAIWDPFHGQLSRPTLSGPSSVEEARAQVDSLSLPAEYAFDIAIEVGRASEQMGLLRVDFTVAGHQGTAWAEQQRNGSDCGVLVIPGSGENQGRAIMAGAGYHGPILDALEGCDVFVQIKPNEDARAIHNGERKLTWNYMHPYMLASGSSYSTVYLTEARALAGWLEERYERTGIIGLSQGGLATLYVGLQAEPDFAVVASGFALTMNPAVMGWIGGFDQIVIPGSPDVWSLDRIARELRRSSTAWLFSMGLQEEGPIGNEARSGAACEWLARTGVDCLIHPGGHEFPMDEIRRLARG